MIHEMTPDVRRDEGKTVYACPHCDRALAIYHHDGSLEIISRGDMSAEHRGSTNGINLSEISVDEDHHRSVAH